MRNAAQLDLVSLTENLNRAARDMPAEMEKVRHTAARYIFEAQLAAVPRKTGRLAASIRIKHTVNRTEIGPEGVPYAVYMEFGTGQFNEFGGAPYEIRPTKPGGTLAFDIGGKTVFAKKVIHPGVRPRPFIRPSVGAAVDRMGADIEKVNHSLLTGKAVI